MLIMMIVIIDDHLISWVHFEVIGRVCDHISSYCCINFVREVQVPDDHHSCFLEEFNLM